jgi:hypothetical protein
MEMAKNQNRSPDPNPDIEKRLATSREDLETFFG